MSKDLNRRITSRATHVTKTVAMRTDWSAIVTRDCWWTTAIAAAVKTAQPFSCSRAPSDDRRMFLRILLLSSSLLFILFTLFGFSFACHKKKKPSNYPITYICDRHHQKHSCACTETRRGEKYARTGGGWY